MVLNGYYEWKLIQGKKQPYYVTTKSQNPLYVAAIYDIFESDSNTDPLYSFTILTCPANDSISWLHERQPLILTESQVSEWIDNRLPPNASIVHRISELSQNNQDDEESTEEPSSNTCHLSYVPEDIISYTVTPNMTSPTYQEDDSFAPYTPRLSRTITSFFQKYPLYHLILTCNRKTANDESKPASDSHEVIDLTNIPKISPLASSNSVSECPKKRSTNGQGAVTNYFKKQKTKSSS